MVLLTGVYSFTLFCVIYILHSATTETASNQVICPKRECEVVRSPFDITRNDALDGLEGSNNFETHPGDMFRDISDDSNVKKISETHDNGFYTSLCWIEITTITETKNGSKSAIREYAITFETPSDIPEKYVDNKTKNNSNENVQYKIFDRDTKKSEVVNFTTVSKSDDAVVRQNRKVLCGSGPGYTKEFMEWPHSERKRVEIRVSPRKQNLVATDCVVMNATMEDLSTLIPTRRDFVGSSLDGASPTGIGEINPTNKLTSTIYTRTTPSDVDYGNQDTTIFSNHLPEAPVVGLVTSEGNAVKESTFISNSFKNKETTTPGFAVTTEKPVTTALHKSNESNINNLAPTVSSPILGFTKFDYVASKTTTSKPFTLKVEETTTKFTTRTNNLKIASTSEKARDVTLKNVQEVAITKTASNYQPSEVPHSTLNYDKTEEERIGTTYSTRIDSRISVEPHKITDKSKTTMEWPAVKYTDKLTSTEPLKYNTGKRIISTEQPKHGDSTSTVESHKKEGKSEITKYFKLDSTPGTGSSTSWSNKIKYSTKPESDSLFKSSTKESPQGTSQINYVTDTHENVIVNNKISQGTSKFHNYTLEYIPNQSTASYGNKLRVPVHTVSKQSVTHSYVKVPEWESNVYTGGDNKTEGNISSPPTDNVITPKGDNELNGTTINADYPSPNVKDFYSSSRDTQSSSKSTTTSERIIAQQTEEQATPTDYSAVDYVYYDLPSSPKIENVVLDVNNSTTKVEVSNPAAPTMEPKPSNSATGRLSTQLNVNSQTEKNPSELTDTTHNYFKTQKSKHTIKEQILKTTAASLNDHSIETKEKPSKISEAMVEDKPVEDKRVEVSHPYFTSKRPESSTTEVRLETNSVDQKLEAKDITTVRVKELDSEGVEKNDRPTISSLSKGYTQGSSIKTISDLPKISAVTIKEHSVKDETNYFTTKPGRLTSNVYLQHTTMNHIKNVKETATETGNTQGVTETSKKHSHLITNDFSSRSTTAPLQTTIAKTEEQQKTKVTKKPRSHINNVHLPDNITLVTAKELAEKASKENSNSTTKDFRVPTEGYIAEGSTKTSKITVEVSDVGTTKGHTASTVKAHLQGSTVDKKDAVLKTSSVTVKEPGVEVTSEKVDRLTAESFDTRPTKVFNQATTTTLKHAVYTSKVTVTTQDVEKDTINSSTEGPKSGISKMHPQKDIDKTDAETTNIVSLPSGMPYLSSSIPSHISLDHSKSELLAAKTSTDGLTNKSAVPKEGTTESISYTSHKDSSKEHSRITVKSPLIRNTTKYFWSLESDTTQTTSPENMDSESLIKTTSVKPLQSKQTTEATILQSTPHRSHQYSTHLTGNSKGISPTTKINRVSLKSDDTVTEEIHVDITDSVKNIGTIFQSSQQPKVEFTTLRNVLNLSESTDKNLKLSENDKVSTKIPLTPYESFASVVSTLPPQLDHESHLSQLPEKDTSVSTPITIIDQFRNTSASGKFEHTTGIVQEQSTNVIDHSQSSKGTILNQAKTEDTISSHTSRVDGLTSTVSPVTSKSSLDQGPTWNLISAKPDQTAKVTVGFTDRSKKIIESNGTDVYQLELHTTIPPSTTGENSRSVKLTSNASTSKSLITGKSTTPKPTQTITDTFYLFGHQGTTPKPAQAITGSFHSSDQKVTTPKPAQVITDSFNSGDQQGITPKPAQAITDSHLAIDQQRTTSKPAQIITDSFHSSDQRVTTLKPGQVITDGFHSSDQQGTTPKPAQVITGSFHSSDQQGKTPTPVDVITQSLRTNDQHGTTPKSAQAITGSFHSSDQRVRTTKTAQVITDSFHSIDDQGTTPKPAEVITSGFQSIDQQGTTAKPAQIITGSRHSIDQQVTTAKPAQIITGSPHSIDQQVTTTKPAQVITDSFHSIDDQGTTPKPAKVITSSFKSIDQQGTTANPAQVITDSFHSIKQQGPTAKPAQVITDSFHSIADQSTSQKPAEVITDSFQSINQKGTTPKAAQMIQDGFHSINQQGTTPKPAQVITNSFHSINQQVTTAKSARIITDSLHSSDQQGTSPKPAKVITGSFHSIDDQGTSPKPAQVITSTLYSIDKKSTTLKPAQVVTDTFHTIDQHGTTSKPAQAITGSHHPIDQQRTTSKTTQVIANSFHSSDQRETTLKSSQVITDGLHSSDHQVTTSKSAQVITGSFHTIDQHGTTPKPAQAITGSYHSSDQQVTTQQPAEVITDSFNTGDQQETTPKLGQAITDSHLAIDQQRTTSKPSQIITDSFHSSNERVTTLKPGQVITDGFHSSDQQETTPKPAQVITVSFHTSDQQEKTPKPGQVITDGVHSSDQQVTTPKPAQVITDSFSTIDQHGATAKPAPAITGSYHAIGSTSKPSQIITDSFHSSDQRVTTPKPAQVITHSFHSGDQQGTTLNPGQVITDDFHSSDQQRATPKPAQVITDSFHTIDQHGTTPKPAEAITGSYHVIDEQGATSKPAQAITDSLHSSDQQGTTPKPSLVITGSFYSSDQRGTTSKPAPVITDSSHSIDHVTIIKGSVNYPENNNMISQQPELVSRIPYVNKYSTNGVINSNALTGDVQAAFTSSNTTIKPLETEYIATGNEFGQTSPSDVVDSKTSTPQSNVPILNNTDAEIHTLVEIISRPNIGYIISEPTTLKVTGTNTVVPNNYETKSQSLSESATNLIREDVTPAQISELLTSGGSLDELFSTQASNTAKPENTEDKIKFASYPDSEHATIINSFSSEAWVDTPIVTEVIDNSTEDFSFMPQQPITIVNSQLQPGENESPTESDQAPNPLKYFDILCNTSNEKVLIKIKILMEHVLEGTDNGVHYKHAVPIMGIEKKTEFDIKQTSNNESHKVPGKVLSKHWEKFLDDLTHNFFYLNKDKVSNFSDLPTKNLNLSAPEFDFKGTVFGPDESLKRMQHIRQSLGSCSNRTNAGHFRMHNINPEFRIDNMFEPLQRKSAMLTTALYNLQNKLEMKNPIHNYSNIYKFLMSLKTKTTERENQDELINVDPTKSMISESEGPSTDVFNYKLQVRDPVNNRVSYSRMNDQYPLNIQPEQLHFRSLFPGSSRFGTYSDLPIAYQNPILTFRTKVYQPNPLVRNRNDYSFVKNFGPIPFNPDAIPNVPLGFLFYNKLTNRNSFLGMNSAANYRAGFRRLTEKPKLRIRKETVSWVIPRIDTEVNPHDSRPSAPVLISPVKAEQVAVPSSSSTDEHSTVSTNKTLINIAAASKDVPNSKAPFDFANLLNAIINKLSSLLEKLSRR